MYSVHKSKHQRQYASDGLHGRFHVVGNRYIGGGIPRVEQTHHGNLFLRRHAADGDIAPIQLTTGYISESEGPCPDSIKRQRGG